MTWPMVPLAELIAAPLANGRSVPTQADGFPVLRLTALRNGAIELGERKGGAWTRSDAERFLVRAGDFLVARGNGSLDLVGRGGLVCPDPDPVAFPDTMIRVRPDTARLEPRYLALAWTAPATRTQIEDSARTTAGIYKINQAHLGAIRVPVPPLDEQRRIVGLLDDHLSRLDAAERELHSARAKQDLLWLSTLSSLRRELLGERQARIGDIAETSLGKMLDAKRQTGTPTRYLRNINVRWGAFDLTDVQLTPLTEADLVRFNVRTGDVMVCEGGEPGRCAVWRGSADIAFQKALHRIRVHGESEMLPEFLALMLTDAIRSGRSDRLFTGTTIRHLPQEKLRTIEIPAPSLDRQRDALARAEDVTSGRARLGIAIDQGLLRASAMRRSLLTAAFTGRLAGQGTELSVGSIAS